MTQHLSFYSGIIFCNWNVIRLGVWLLKAGAGDIEIFVRVKLAGTVAVVAILTCLWRYNRRTALPVTTSIEAWQTGLLAYLTFA